MIDTAALIFDYLKITFKGVIQFRANFVSGVVGLALSSLFQLLGAVVVISHFGDAAGWNVAEVIFMFGLWRIQYGAMLIFAGSLWGLEYIIRDGLFDRLLVRPRGILVQLPGLRFSISGVGQIGMGLAMVVYGATQASIEWSIWSVPWILLILLCGTLIQISIFAIMGSFSLYHIRVSAAIGQIDKTSWQINIFPLSVYAAALQGVLTFVIPWGFMVFYPAYVVLGKTNDFVSSSLIYMAPLATLAIMGVAAIVWNRALSRYQGMGGA